MNLKNKEQERAYLGMIKDHYTSDTTLFMSWCDSQDLPYDLDSLSLWIDELRYRGYASATIRRRFYAIKTRLRLLIQAGDNSEDEKALALYNIERRSREVKLPKRATFAVKQTKFFTLDEIKKVITEAPPRVALWIEFLYITGLRIDEACKIRIRNLQQESPKIYSIRVTGKGRKERIVFINSGLRRRLRETFRGNEWLLETSKGSMYDEKNVWRMLRRAGSETLGRVLTPHCLRHSFTAHRIRETGKITGVSLYLGHADISTTLGEYNNELLHPEEIIGGLWGDKGRTARSKNAEES